MNNLFHSTSEGSALLSSRPLRKAKTSRKTFKSTQHSINLPEFEKQRPATSKEALAQQTHRQKHNYSHKEYRAHTNILTKNYVVPKTYTPEFLLSSSVEQMEVSEMKKVLVALIHKERDSFAKLLTKIQELESVVYSVEKSKISEKNSKELKHDILLMADKCAYSSHIEIELGIKNRELVSKNMQLASVKNKYQAIHKRCTQNEKELKELKDKVKKLEEENTRLQKTIMTERQRFSRKS